MKRAIAILVSVVLLAALAIGQTTTVDVRYRTTAPTTGSPVAVYAWQVSTDGGATWTNARTSTGVEVVLSLAAGVPVLVRVAGIDAQDRQGPWSPVSDPYTPDAGAPGGCGKPAVVK